MPAPNLPKTLSGNPSLLRWQPVFLFLVGTLSSTILLKVGQIQYLEFVYLVQIAILLTLFDKNHFQVTLFRPFLRLANYYLVISLATLVLAFAALRFDFYFPENVAFIERPLIIAVARLVELAFSVSAMLYLAHLFRNDSKALRSTMRIYFWTGMASVFYSLLSFPLALAGLDQFGVYSDSYRFRGFYNEGGPYGLYLISVFLIGVALLKKGWISGRTLTIVSVPFLVAFLMAQSKAALSAIIVLTALNAVLSRGIKTRLLTCAVGAVCIYVGAQFLNFTNIVSNYRRVSAAYERLSHYHSEDGNFVYGRVAAAFIIPRMIAEHPITGIGLGNYSLLRNAPEYRGASVWVRNYDLPGLGLLGYAAELGLPLFFFLYACLFLPYFYLRKIDAPSHIANLALLQPIVHTFGAQLNVTYPWIVTAFALGLGFAASPSAVPSDVSAAPARSLA